MPNTLQIIKLPNLVVIHMPVARKAQKYFTRLGKRGAIFGKFSFKNTRKKRRLTGLFFRENPPTVRFPVLNEFSYKTDFFDLAEFKFQRFSRRNPSPIVRQLVSEIARIARVRKSDITAIFVSTTPLLFPTIPPQPIVVPVFRTLKLPKAKPKYMAINAYDVYKQMGTMALAHPIFTLAKELIESKARKIKVENK